jgi:tetratricopeptide (TPR) repeat protein
MKSPSSGVLCFLIVSVLLGCSMPRIIILDDPLTADEHLTLGMAYDAKQEYDAAVREYESAAKKLNIAYLYLGNLHFKKGDMEKAEQYYKKAVKAGDDPPIADAYNNLAWLYYTKKEKLDEAELLAAKAIQLQPQSREHYEDTLMKIRELKKHLSH